MMNRLLQTEEYAAAIIAAGSPNIRLAEVDRRVTARMMRQRRLTADTRLDLTVVMGESTVRQQVGGPGVLERQLRHLLDLIERLPDSLEVRVVPYTATGHHAMGGSAFHLMTFPSAMLPTLTWQETVTSTQLIEDSLTVREYSLAYAEVEKAALDRRDCVDVMTQAVWRLS